MSTTDFHIPSTRGRGERLARCTAPPAHSPPLPPSSGCLTQIQTLRIASTQALIDAVTAALPPPPLPPLPPSLSMPSPVDRRDDIPETEQPPRKRLHLSTLGSRYEIGESSTTRPTKGQGIDYGFVSTVDAEERRQGIRDVGYGIRDTWVDPAEAVPEIAPMTVGEVNTRVVELAELHERDTQDLYALLEDAQDSTTRDHILQLAGEVTLHSDNSTRSEGASRGELETAWVQRIGFQDHQEASGDADSHIYGCAVENQVKFATCTLLGAALTWWNGQIRTLGPEAYAMTWEVLKKKMTDKDIVAIGVNSKKLEIELSEPEGLKEMLFQHTLFVDKYISGLPNNIYGNVKSARPKTLDETIELANDLMDQKLRTYAEKGSEGKDN
ncbi:hypothetical protein Tco_1562427 [Tanacetum coccineum]